MFSKNLVEAQVYQNPLVLLDMMTHEQLLYVAMENHHGFMSFVSPALQSSSSSLPQGPPSLDGWDYESKGLELLGIR